MAEEFQSELRRFIIDRLPELPPSERAPYEAILGQLRTVRVDDSKTYFITANLSIPNEARKLEALLTRNGVRGVLQSATHWTPDGSLISYMAISMTPALYAQVLEEEKPPARISWWRRFLPGG